MALMSSASGKLTEEQRRRIEENRRKALEKRASRIVQQKSTSATFATGGSSYNKHYGGSNATSNSSSSSSNVSQVSSSQTDNARNSNGHGFGSSSVPLSARQDGTAPSHSKDSAPTFYALGSKPHFQASLRFQNPHRQQSLANPPPSTWKSRPSGSSFSKSSFDKLGGKGPFVKSGKNATECKIFQRSAEKPVRASCVLVSRGRFTVNVSYQADLIGMFKTMPSRNYDAKTTKWTFALEDYQNLMSAAKSLPPHVSVEPLPKSIIAAFLRSTPGVLKNLSTEEINLNSVDAKLVTALMPFQKEGVSFSIRHDGRVLIADDMGLGKTIQAICVACYYRKEWPLLIITPSSLRLTWRQAIVKWMPSVDPQFINVVLTGKDNPTSGLINIISYDLLSKFVDQVKKKQFRVIIADESHCIKNFKATRTKAALPLLKDATRVVLLSGTPALSRPCELYTQVTAVQPQLLPSFHQFGIRYCAGAQNRWGWDYSGASNMEELQLLLEEKVLIRRLKKDVLSQLPSKMRQMVTLDPSLVKTRPLEKAAKQVANAQKRKEQNGALLHYFSESCEAKIPAVREYVLDLLEGGHKFLVFAHHKGMLDAISQCLTSKKRRFIRIDGSTPAGTRQSLCDKFQKDSECTVAVLSITAANTGLTLTAATAVVFAELFWNPGALVQAEDRVYRIGQKNSVNVHYLVAKGTADDYLWPLVQEKLEVLNKAGLSGDDFSAADFTTFQDPNQKTLLSYIELFIEDNEDLSSMDIEKLAENTSGKTAREEPEIDNVAVTSQADSDATSWIDAIEETIFTSDCSATGPSHVDDESLEPRAKRSRK